MAERLEGGGVDDCSGVVDVDAVDLASYPLVVSSKGQGFAGVLKRGNDGPSPVSHGSRQCPCRIWQFGVVCGRAVALRLSLKVRGPSMAFLVVGQRYATRRCRELGR